MDLAGNILFGTEVISPKFNSGAEFMGFYKIVNEKISLGLISGSMNDNKFGKLIDIFPL